MQDEQDRAAKKLQDTLDDHAAEMRRFRQEQEAKDAENRSNIDKMRAEFEQLLRD